MKSPLLQEYLKRILTARVYDLAQQTPLSRMESVSCELDADVWLKREDKQEIFSFKLRGAANKLAHLSDAEKAAGVVAASAGNHAQGVAMAAKFHGIEATIVMPQSTPSIKVNAVKAYGARVILYGDGLSEAQNYAADLAEETGTVSIHPYDDPDVIAGQGTIGIEILQQSAQTPDAIFVPVGGGGLIGGVGAYIKSVAPEIKIIGVEPLGAASMDGALKAGERITLDQIDRFSDGVAVRKVGEIPFQLAHEAIDEIILVSIDQICAAVRDIFEGVRAIVEPAGALALAGLKQYARQQDVAGQNLVAIVSGANVNFDRFGTIVERAELGSGREVLLAVKIPEEPGSFLRFCKVIGKRNITEFNYRYTSESEAQVLAGIRIDEHGDEDREGLIKTILDEGFPVCDLTQNEMAKQHIRYMVGGATVPPEREVIYRFEFPEREGALVDFLAALAGRWSISLFHYRNHGEAYGQVLIGMQVPEADQTAFEDLLKNTGFAFWDETHNLAYHYFLLPPDARPAHDHAESA